MRDFNGHTKTRLAVRLIESIFWRWSLLPWVELDCLLSSTNNKAEAQAYTCRVPGDRGGSAYPTRVARAWQPPRHSDGVWWAGASEAQRARASARLDHAPRANRVAYFATTTPTMTVTSSGLSPLRAAPSASARAAPPPLALSKIT